jgi:hypothetical protein
MLKKILNIVIVLLLVIILLMFPQRSLASNPTTHIYLPLSLQQFIAKFMPNYTNMLDTSTESQSKASEQLNEAKEDQDLNLNNVVINKVIIIDPLIREPMYYGLLLNLNGKTEEIIDNFDCEYNVLNSADKLRLTDHTTLPLKTKTYETNETFSNMTVKKITDINTSVAMFSSRSFTYNNKTYNCDKIGTGQRFSSWVKTTSKNIGNYIIQIVDRIKS